MSIFKDITCDILWFSVHNKSVTYLLTYL